MKKAGKVLIDLIPVGLGLLLAAGSATVFSACGIKEDGTWMHCHSAQDTVVLCAGVLSAVLLIPVLCRWRWLRLVAGGLGIIAAIVIFLLPGQLMPLCMMHTMRCYTLFQPFVRVMAGLIALACALSGIRAAKESRLPKEGAKR